MGPFTTPTNEYGVRIGTMHCCQQCESLRFDFVDKGQALHLLDSLQLLWLKLCLDGSP